MLKTILFSVSALGLVACGGTTQSVPVEPEIVETGAPAEPEIVAAVFDSSTMEGLSVVDWLNARLAEGMPIAYVNPVDEAGAQFVQLALQLGRLDGDYVDAYHGPEVWEAAAAAMTPDPAVLAGEIKDLANMLNTLEGEGGQELIRINQLKKLTRAMGVRLQVLHGEEPVSFNEEVTEIYDEQVPAYGLAEYNAVLAELEGLLPGGGGLASRVDAFRNSLAIPEDKLQEVFDRAIAECKARTQAHFELPTNETFRLEFVTDKSWSGYNYYQGGYESLIQINTDFPIIIDRAVDLGCHEGYPGHHVWNLFIEKELLGERGWIEYSVNPLFGPFGPIAEGSANYGVELAFPGDEKIEFEREVLFPMAGLDPEDAEKLEALNALTGKLSHATNEVARRYIQGRLTRDEAVLMIQKFYLASPEKSEQRLRFIEQYRAYVINYNVGRDRAASWVEAAGEDEEARWAAFREMLTTPMTPEDIIEALD